MKCFVNWIPVNLHVRLNKTQSCFNFEVFERPSKNGLFEIFSGRTTKSKFLIYRVLNGNCHTLAFLFVQLGISQFEGRYSPLID